MGRETRQVCLLKSWPMRVWDNTSEFSFRSQCKYVSLVKAFFVHHYGECKIIPYEQGTHVLMIIEVNLEIYASDYLALYPAFWSNPWPFDKVQREHWHSFLMENDCSSLSLTSEYIL